MANHRKEQSHRVRLIRLGRQLSRHPMVLGVKRASDPKRAALVMLATTMWGKLEGLRDEFSVTRDPLFDLGCVEVPYVRVDEFVELLDAAYVIDAVTREPKKMDRFGPNLQNAARGFQKYGKSAESLRMAILQQNVILGTHFDQLIIDDPHKSNDAVDAMTLAFAAKK